MARIKVQGGRGTKRGCRGCGFPNQLGPYIYRIEPWRFPPARSRWGRSGIGGLHPPRASYKLYLPPRRLVLPPRASPPLIIRCSLLPGHTRVQQTSQPLILVPPLLLPLFYFCLYFALASILRTVGLGKIDFRKKVPLFFIKNSAPISFRRTFSADNNLEIFSQTAGNVSYLLMRIKTFFPK